MMHSGRINYWTGEQGRLFEEEFAAFCGSRHAVAVANGTLALELALRALGIGDGNEQITSSRTFVASLSCIAICGAKPVFADVDRDSQNISAETIRAALTSKTRAIIVVHLAGWPCEMDSILGLARKRGLYVTEDCAQAQGATWNGKPVGSLGDMAVFSFCQEKIMTTLGEGGMLVTNDSRFWEKVWPLKDPRRNHPASFQTNHKNGFRWLHDYVGTNARMTEAQATVGRLRLRKLPDWLERRRSHASELSKRLSQITGLARCGPEFQIGTRLLSLLCLRRAAAIKGRLEPRPDYFRN